MFSRTNDVIGGGGGNDNDAYGDVTTRGSDSMGGGFDDDDDADDPFNNSVGQDLFEKMMNDSTDFKTTDLFNNSARSIGDQVQNLVGAVSASSGQATSGAARGADVSDGGNSNNSMFFNNNQSNRNNEMDTNDMGDLNPEALLAELEYMEPTIYERDPTSSNPPPSWNTSDQRPRNYGGGNSGMSPEMNTMSLQQQQHYHIFGTSQNSRTSNPGGNANFASAAARFGGVRGGSVGPMNGSTTLDAAPLNIALGGGLLAKGGASVFSSSNFQRKGSNPSLHHFNKKGSNPSLHNFNHHKANVVFRASKKGFKSSKSEGLLARALKAKYGSSTQLASFNMNTEQAVPAINQNSGDNVLPMNSMGGASGAQNATWGSHGGDGGGVRGGVSRVAGSTSAIQRLLMTKTSNSISSKMSRMASCDSTSALFSSKLKLGSSGVSRSSMQDLLRQSRKQSKTQSMLRQSSAHSLMRKSSLQSLQDPSGKVDVSSLLRPQHVNSRRSLNRLTGLGSQSDFGSISGRANASFDMPTVGSTMLNGQHQYGQASIGTNVETLLHQSCRLYPTTNAVVESALRVDPDAVRRPVSGEGKNSYGYPINVALSHRASVEVLAMLVNAGPDVLVKKDGSEGSGSLGIALAANWDLNVIDLLLNANRECASVADRRGNYPLHIAVSAGLPLTTVKRVLIAYPQAQEMRNFHSQTPLEIAQRSMRVGEDVLGFLQATALTLQHDSLGGNLRRRAQGNLEEGLDDIMETNFG